MKMLLSAAAALGLMAAAAGASAAEIEIKNAVARVVVIPEARADISYQVIPGRADLPRIEARRGMDGRIILDGGLRSMWGGMSCSRRGGPKGEVISATHPPGDLRISVNGHRDVALAEAPLIVVHTPLDVRVNAGDAVFGNIGRADNVHLGLAGCGDWTVGNVRGRLDADIAGSGDIHAGSAHSLRAQIGGSGDVTASEVGDLEANIAGSGDVWVRRADGTVRAHIAGSGDVVAADGHATSLHADIAGSGDVRFGGDADSVNANIVGSGDVRVKRVKGEIHKSVIGSGTVVVGG